MATPFLFLLSVFAQPGIADDTSRSGPQAHSAARKWPMIPNAASPALRHRMAIWNAIMRKLMGSPSAEEISILERCTTIVDQHVRSYAETGEARMAEAVQPAIADLLQRFAGLRVRSHVLVDDRRASLQDRNFFRRWGTH